MSELITDVTSDPKLVGWEASHYPGTLDALCRVNGKTFRISYIEFRRNHGLDSDASFTKYVVDQVKEFVGTQPIEGCECGCNPEEQDNE